MTTADNLSTGLRAIGAVGREVGLTTRAIRYYEQFGLLRPAVGVKGADRLYDDSDVERLKVIKELRQVIGFSLAEIAELLETDETRKQIGRCYKSNPDQQVQAKLLLEAVSLSERRLAIFEHKLAQVQVLRCEEQARLEKLRNLLGEDRVVKKGRKVQSTK